MSREPRGESAGLNPRRDLLVAGCRTGDNLGPREEAPLSAGQGQACLPHAQSLSDSCLGAGEGGSEGGGTLPLLPGPATSSPATFVLSSKRRRSGFKGS